MTTIKNGSKGEEVKTLQSKLNDFAPYGLTVDGIFGAKTETAVKDFQFHHNLTVDGIVGSKTWAALGVTGTTSGSTSSSGSNPSPYTTPQGLVINPYYLPKGEYVAGPTKKDLILLHHTAGWNNPYNTISGWGRDSQGRVATEFVVGGMKSDNGDETYDGVVAQAFPAGAWGYHIGTPVGVSGMNERSVGIENCNFGHVKDGKTYTGSVVQPSQIVTLAKPFRGYTQYHRYSDKQLESLRKLLLYIADRDNIDLHNGIYKWVKEQGAGGFDFQSDAYYGKVKGGMVTHANIRKDKEDMFPQPELIDMILSL